MTPVCFIQWNHVVHKGTPNANFGKYMLKRGSNVQRTTTNFKLVWEHEEKQLIQSTSCTILKVQVWTWDDFEKEENIVLLPSATDVAYFSHVASALFSSLYTSPSHDELHQNVQMSEINPWKQHKSSLTATSNSSNAPLSSFLAWRSLPQLPCSCFCNRLALQWVCWSGWEKITNKQSKNTLLKLPLGPIFSTYSVIKFWVDDFSCGLMQVATSRNIWLIST